MISTRRNTDKSPNDRRSFPDTILDDLTELPRWFYDRVREKMRRDTDSDKTRERRRR